MYKHVIKMPQIQRIRKISHIICLRVCYPLIERVKNIMNVYHFQQRDKRLCVKRNKKHVNVNLLEKKKREKVSWNLKGLSKIV